MIEFTPVGCSKFMKWIDNIIDDYDEAEADVIFSNAMNIGRIALESSNLISGEKTELNGIKDAISEILNREGDELVKMVGVENDSVIERLKLENSNIINTVKTLVDEIRGFGILSEGSSKKGKAVEKVLLKTLTQEFPDWSFAATGYETSSADIIATHATNLRIAIELKNYTNVVPTKEITKFEKDISATGVDGAIFISVSSGITGITGNIDISQKLIGTKIVPSILIANAGMTSSPILGFMMISEILLKLQNSTETPTTSSQSTITSANTEIQNAIFKNLQNELSLAITRMNSIEVEVSRSRNEYSDMRKKIIDLLDIGYKNAITLELTMKNELSNIKRNFQEITFDAIHFSDTDADDFAKTIISQIKTLDEYSDLILKKKNKPAYMYLWEVIVEIPGIKVFRTSDDEICIRKRIKSNGNKIIKTIGKTFEKPQSVQFSYIDLASDGLSLTFPYEVVNASGAVYFNLSKIRNDVGKDILQSRIAANRDQGGALDPL
jgi:hypothetical protein